MYLGYLLWYFLNYWQIYLYYVKVPYLVITAVLLKFEGERQEIEGNSRPQDRIVFGQKTVFDEESLGIC